MTHLLHHADMGVNSKAFHRSPTGHTSEDPQWAGGDQSAVSAHLWHHRKRIGGEIRQLL